MLLVLRIFVFLPKRDSVIYRVKNMVENNHLYMLYCSVIIPFLLYACEIWRNTFKSLLQTLLLLQKKAIRYIHPIPFVFNINY